MSVRLAALIPLFACFLVLPSDVSGQRRIRQTLQEETKEYVSRILMSSSLKRRLNETDEVLKRIIYG